MASEQAKARMAGKRAVIPAFGVVFFEILTGQRLFAEGSISDTLAAVLKNGSMSSSIGVKLLFAS
jgi:hypothetical protein